MIELTGQQITDEIIAYVGKGNYFQTTSYDTTLIITSDKGYDPFHRFDLFDRKILWINPVLHELRGQKVTLMARTVFVCDPNNYDGGIVMNRFASLLCFVTSGTPIITSTHIGFGHPAATSVQPQQMVSAITYGHEEIDSLIDHHNPKSFPEKKWIALAHYRQGIIALTPYYDFLSHWKILELYFSDNDAAVDKYIDDNVGKQQLESLSDGKASASETLRKIRNMSAHFALRGGDVQDPDNPKLYLEAEKGTGILEKIARDLIDNGKW